MNATTTPHPFRRSALAVAVFAVVIAACSDGPDGGSSDAPQPTASNATTPTSGPATTTPTATTEAPIDPSTFVPVELPPANWDGLDEWRLPALGGVTFGIPEGHTVHHDADMVMVHADVDDAGRYEPSMVLAHVSQGPLTFNVDSDDLIEFAETSGVGSVQASGTTLELMDLAFTGYDFVADPDSELGPHYLYPADRPPVERPTWWQPFPRSRLFLADTDTGVMVVGAIGTDEATLADATALFERVAPTIEWSGAIKKPITPVSHPDEPDSTPPPTLPVPSDWPDVLLAGFQPLEPGEHATTALVTPMRFTAPDGWWVQPNFVAWFVLTDDESFGPGDREIDFRLRADRIVGLNSDFEMIGEPIEIAAGEPWPADQLPTLEIGEAVDVTIGGVDARQFDVRIADDAACTTDSPCEYVVFAPPTFPPLSIRKGFSVRFWDIYGADEPILAMASDGSEAFLDVASQVIDGIEFASG